MYCVDQSNRRSVPTSALYFQEINQTQLLNSDDECDLAWRVQDGDSEARDHMVMANLRLVVAIARTFVGRGLCISDLIQEGNLGLVHAVERFDPTQKTRFSTYAKYWIKEAIGSALEKSSGPVRVPGYANDLKLAWQKTANNLREELGRNPVDEEIAVRLKMSKRRLTIVQKAQRIQQQASRHASPGDIESAADSLVDSRASRPDASLCAEEELRQVLKLIAQFPARDASVLRLRFGLSGQDPMTLQEIGNALDLTRERVRQIERDGLAKLRNLIEEAA